MSRLFRIRPNAAAAFELKVLNYGLEPANDRRLAGSIWLETRLVNGAGERIWSKRVRGLSNTNAFLNDFERYPALWPQVMDEAIADVTQKTILYAE